MKIRWWGETSTSLPWAYIERKLEMSRANPKASRLFANEILHGAPNVMNILTGELKQLVDEKCTMFATRAGTEPT